MSSKITKSFYQLETQKIIKFNCKKNLKNKEFKVIKLESGILLKNKVNQITKLKKNLYVYKL
jgi:hypothetical protein